MNEQDPSKSFENAPPVDNELPRRRTKKGHARLVVEVPAPLVMAATARAKDLRRPLAQIVEDALRLALRTEGVLVALAAILVGGCHAPGDAATDAKPCAFPAELPCSFGDAPPSRAWDSMVWSSGEWAEEPDTGAP
jgi:hypothetical protein